MAFLLAGSARAVVPLTNDLFDVSTGTIITSTSGIGGGTAAGMLGAPVNLGGELDDGYFSDGNPGGFANFIEFKTPSPVTIKGLVLWAGDDRSSGNTGRRSFSEFKLYGWNGTSFQLQLDKPITIPYATQVAVFGALVVNEALPTPFTSDKWRAEFIQPAGTTFGPRVIELDGVSTPEPGSIVTISLGLLVLGRRSRRQLRFA